MEVHSSAERKQRYYLSTILYLLLLKCEPDQVLVLARFKVSGFTWERLGAYIVKYLWIGITSNKSVYFNMLFQQSFP